MWIEGTWRDLVKGDLVVSDQGEPWQVTQGLCEDSPKRVHLVRDGVAFSFTPTPTHRAVYQRGDLGRAMDVMNRCGLNVSVIR